MSYVHALTCEELRVVLCMAFDRHAAPAEIAAFKDSLIQSEHCLHSVEATGAFDFLAEFAAPDMNWYNEWLLSTAEPLSRLLTDFKSSFVCKRYIRKVAPDCALWVRTRDGMKRIDCSLVDKVTSEGDYLHVHSQGQSWMMHGTLRSVLAVLSPEEFLQIHRSVVVRRGFIEHLLRDGRHWVAELQDGSRESIAKSHVAETLEAVRTRSATSQPGSSKLLPIGRSRETA